MTDALRVLTGLLLFGTLGSLQPSAFPHPQYPKRSSACDGAKDQREMNECTYGQYQKSDAHLNAVYAGALKLLNGDLASARIDADRKHAEESVQKLKAAERAWIQYRDLDCDAAKFEFEGGSIVPAVWDNCMTELTDHRIAELKSAYQRPGRELE